MRVANMTFFVNSFETKTVSSDFSNVVFGNDTSLLQLGKHVLSDRFYDNIVDVIFVENSSGREGGRGLNQGNVSAAFVVMKEDLKYASWVVSHEIGHTLGLCDVFEFDNLMIDTESNTRMLYRNWILPTDLAEEQIQIVRNEIFSQHCPHGSCVL